jgi:peptidoglycan/LPS O-acetylase OafA/YrhL
MSLREDYELPKGGTPLFPVWMWFVMVVPPVAALGLWLAFPDSWITVVLLAAAFVVAIGLAIGGLLQSRALERRPSRRPTTPPSVKGS